MPTCQDLKEQALGWQPLLLRTFTFTDDAATILRLCTHPLKPSDGSVQYNGNDYDGRVLNDNIDRIAALGSEGIDRIPKVDTEIADADAAIYTNYEYALGFKGATLFVDLVFWQVGTSNFSSDSRRLFIGICDPPSNMDELSITVSALNKLNMQKQYFPQFPVQRRCPLFFPSTLAERTAAANDPTSKFFMCGYSPDVPGGNARGNLNGSVAFTTCDYVKAACLDRGMY